MSEQRDEQLSALVDGELGPAEGRFLVRQMANDEQARAAWHRYHMIGEAARGGDCVPSMDLADRVRAALADEPALGDIQDEQATSTVVQLARWKRPLVTLALAASLAMVAVLVMREAPLQQGPATAEMVADNVQPQDAMPEVQWELAPPEVQQRLQGYLANHARHGNVSPGQDMLEYIRLVGFDQPVQPQDGQ